MDAWQNLAKTKNVTGKVIPKAPPELSIQQQLWVDYNALGGLITDLMQVDDNGLPVSLKKMSISDFADKLGVSRETLRLWRENIPDFWGKVNERRGELSSGPRLQKMHDVLFKSALKPGKDGFRDRQLWLLNFDPNLKLPNQKDKPDENNSWAAMLNAKRAKLEQEAIEGEIVKDADAAA